MTRDEWNKLKPGDILLQKHNGVPRMVLRVYSSKRVMITLRKLRGSWNDPCPFTVVGYSDVHHKLMSSGLRGSVTKEMLECPRHEHAPCAIWTKL